MSFDYILLVKAELQNVNVIQKTITQRNTKANAKKWQREWEYIIPTFLPLKQIKSSIFLFLNYVLLDIIRVSILDPLLLTSKCHEIRLFLIIWTQLRLHLYLLTCKCVLFLRLAHKTITLYLHLELRVYTDKIFNLQLKVCSQRAWVNARRRQKAFRA